MAFVLYMRITAPFTAVEMSFDSVFMSNVTSDEMNHSVCGNKLKYRLVHVGEWYGLESM